MNADADAEPPPALYHFSEEAGIARFEPRACFWAGPATSPDDPRPRRF